MLIRGHDVRIRLLSIAIVVPLSVSRHTLPLSTFYGEWISIFFFSLIIAVFFWTTRPSANSNTSVSDAAAIPQILLLPLWLFGVCILQEAAGQVDVTESRGLTQLGLALGAAVIWAAWRVRRDTSAQDSESLIDAVATAWLAAALLGVLAQWIQLFQFEADSFGLVSSLPYDNHRRLSGNLYQPNHQATVEGLGLVASIWLANRGRLHTSAWFGVVLLLESGIVLSASRMGVLHVGLASAYTLATAWLVRDSIQTACANTALARSNLLCRPGGLVLGSIALLFLLLILQLTVRSLGQAFNWQLFDVVGRLQEANQVASRETLWAHAWSMFRSHPWLGVGWGEFGWVQFQQAALLGVRAAMSLHAHNELLDLLAKTGIVGAIGVVVSLSWWFRRVLRIRFLQADSGERARTLVVLAWLAVFFVHSMLEYPLHYFYFFLPVCFMLGWLDPLGFVRWRIPAWFSAPIGFILAGTVVAILATTWQDYLRVEAREYIGGERGTALPMPRHWFRAQAEANAIEDIRITRDNAARLLAPHMAAVHLLPTPTLISRTAWLFALVGDTAEGKAWLERLSFYREQDELAQILKIVHACAEGEGREWAPDFCDWVQSYSKSKIKQRIE